jgi:hypothetical protein
MSAQCVSHREGIVYVRVLVVVLQAAILAAARLVL